MADEIDVQTGWTLAAYVAHNEALREAEDKFQAERDRRYTELRTEQEKALGIKEKAEDRALQLAREIQTYKDEKANELREQINRERGLYVTQGDLKAAIERVDETLKPLVSFVAAQQGRSSGGQENRALLFAVIGVATAFILAVIAVLGFLGSPPPTMIPVVP